MSLKTKLRARLIRLLTSDTAQATRRTFAEQRRRLGRKPHVVTAFLELDDPYSYLLSVYLPELAAAYDVTIDYRLAQANYDEAFRPRADLYAAHAERDCARLAAELGVPFLDRGRAPPVEHRRALVEMLAQQGDDFERELRDALAAYWRGDSEAIARRCAGVELEGKGDAMLARNGALLLERGHYNCGTLHYAGEWYWGVDRLHYMMSRLDELGLRRDAAQTPQLASIRQVMQLQLPVAKPGAARDLPALEFFYSFRSPYSYLAIEPVFALCDAFGVRLEIRPVLPMVMRGMQVPRQKMLYILNDTAREARRLGVPFGNFIDPVGPGIKRCMAVFYYALGERRERDFLRHAGEAIWARGIDVATDKGMRKVTGRCGLFWPDVVDAMQRDDWRSTVEANREEMQAAGSWGVPTLRLGDYVVWGQDRVWMLARHIEDICDTGEGILV